MHPDVVDLRDFYRGGLGQLARRMIGQRIRTFWPDLAGQRVLGLGYATPYLRDFRGEAERIVAIMPAAMGVLPWPPEGPNMTVLTEEAELPLPDLSIDRALIVHGIEGTEELRPMLREVWRVLAGGGRLLVVVPNRRGLWARSDRSPFGHGQPYSASQLSRLLRDNMFTPIQSAGALFPPPFLARLWLSSARAWEEAGNRWFPRFAGAVLIEASKQIYAATAVRRPAPRRRLVALPSPQRTHRAQSTRADHEAPE